MDPIGPGNHERAWNDPPKFAFNTSGTSLTGNTSGRRRLLNKRVPVPIGPQTTSSPLPPPLKAGDGPPVGSPPLGCNVVGPPPVRPPTESQLPVKTLTPLKPQIPLTVESKNSEEILKDVECAFENILERVSSHLKDNVREEILKRFGVMKTMWLNGKLSGVVQNRMLALIKALDEERFDDAWTIHQGLIVDFTSMCSPWMIGIKTLVTECRNHKTVGDVETDNQKKMKEDIISPLDIGKVVISDTKGDSDSKSEVEEEK